MRSARWSGSQQPDVDDAPPHQKRALSIPMYRRCTVQSFCIGAICYNEAHTGKDLIKMLCRPQVAPQSMLYSCHGKTVFPPLNGHLISSVGTEMGSEYRERFAWLIRFLDEPQLEREHAFKSGDRATVTDGETFERFLESRAYKMFALGTNLLSALSIERGHYKKLLDSWTRR